MTECDNGRRTKREVIYVEYEKRMKTERRFKISVTCKYNGIRDLT
jgi:hypothetical protein